nr:MAG TPA: hypothetical protein [Caudoviricetes sp.]
MIPSTVLRYFIRTISFMFYNSSIRIYPTKIFIRSTIKSNYFSE